MAEQADASLAGAAGTLHSLGLKANGSIAAWGDNEYGQCDVPSPNTDFVALAAAGYRSRGIRGYPRGDLDHDRDIDLDDFELLPDCLLGPDVPLPPECDATIDPDGDADLADLALFQTLFTGPR